MNDVARKTLDRVTAACASKVGFWYQFLAPLLLQLLSQWVHCDQPKMAYQRDNLAGKILKKAKRVRRKQIKRGDTPQPEVTVRMAREMADIAIAEWQARDAETSEQLLAACPAPDFFEDDDE